MGALMDNLEVLTGTQEGGNWGRAATNDLLRNRIKIRSLNFMRGRTFLNRYLILDEAQNLTPEADEGADHARRSRDQTGLPGQYRPDRHALPDGDDLGPDLCREPLPRLAAFGAHHPGPRASARDWPTTRRISCNRRSFVSFCKRRKLEPASHGRMRTMRRLILLLIAGAVFATVACAVEPVSTSRAARCRRPAVPDRRPARTVANGLPDMGSPEAAVISHSDERQLGYMIVQQLRDQNALIEDPELNEYVNSIGDRLAAQSPDGAQGFQFFVVKDPVINAFAVPGGFVFINYGLILATDSESELASVLGHEIAHVTQHHIARAIRAQSQQSHDHRWPPCWRPS